MQAGQMTPAIGAQGCAEDVAGTNVAKLREICRFVPSSKEEEPLCDASKGSETSACKEPLHVLDTTTKESQLSKFETLGKSFRGERAALEVTLACASKKGAIQSGIMDFLTALDKKQGLKLDKSVNRSSKQTQLRKAELHRSTRFKKALNEKKDNSLASRLSLPSTNFEHKGYSLEKEDDQNLSPLSSTGFLSDFFLPASKKCKWQTRQELANESITVCVKASKSASPSRMPNHVKAREATSKSQLIILKQSTTNEDFFRPASKKQKQMVNKEAPLKGESKTKVEVRDENHFEINLQMEARLAAEENAQLCAGKPTHPFFSQQKVGPRPSSACCTSWDASLTFGAQTLKVHDLTPALPFHINQLDNAEDCEAGSQPSSFAPSFLEKKKDNFVYEAHFSASSMQELQMLLKRPFLGNFCKTERLKTHCSDHAKECSGVSSDLSSRCTPAASSIRNLLWTDVYQPQLPEQVCGNSESVKSLSEWLQHWKIRRTLLGGYSEGDTLNRSVSSGEDHEENEAGFEEESYDGENTSSDYLLPNVLVLAGPVGCGKTSAICACAKAYAYKVIEVNSSDNRSGALINQKFSEAMESHRVGNRSADAMGFPQTKRHHSAAINACKGSTLVAEAEKVEALNGNEKTGNFAATIGSSDTQWIGENDESGDNKEMTVLLFEDVDVVFEDDRGFMAAVSQVAMNAKRPIILTSNDRELCLPQNLCAQMLEFKRPCTQDLVSLAHLACMSEGVVCSPGLLQKVVHACNHDARKMLNFLQFWCQDQSYMTRQYTDLEKGVAYVGKDEKEMEYSPVELQGSDFETITSFFEMEAQHRLWPVYIDLAFPCKVTQLLSCELSKAVLEMEMKHRVDSEKKLVQEMVRKRVLRDKMKRRSKDSWFNHPYDWEGEDIEDDSSTDEEPGYAFAPAEHLEEAKSNRSSPALPRKRRQLAIIMSDSEDDDDASDVPHHEDEHHEHVQPIKPLSPLGILEGIDTNYGVKSPVPSSLHAEGDTLDACTKCDAMQTSNTSRRTESLSSSNNPHEELGDIQAEPCISLNNVEPVYNLWSYFRVCSKNRDEFLLSAASTKSFSVVLSLSDLSENLSACDIISSLHRCQQDVKEEETLMFSLHENSDYGNLSICGQIAHESFWNCLQDAREIAGCTNADVGAVSLKDMSMAVDDPCTLGKLATEGKFNDRGRTSYGLAGALCIDQDQIRLEKKSSLQMNLLTDLMPMAVRSFHGAASYECLGFLARMESLARDTVAAVSTRQRSGGHQSFLCHYPWNLSEKSITMVQSYGKLGWLCVEDVPTQCH